MPEESCPECDPIITRTTMGVEVRRFTPESAGPMPEGQIMAQMPERLLNHRPSPQVIESMRGLARESTATPAPPAEAVPFDRVASGPPLDGPQTVVEPQAPAGPASPTLDGPNYLAGSMVTAGPLAGSTLDDLGMFQQEKEDAEKEEPEPLTEEQQVCKLPISADSFPANKHQGRMKAPSKWDTDAMREKLEEEGVDILKMSLIVYNCEKVNEEDLKTQLEGAANILLQAGIELDYEIKECPKEADPKKSWYGLEAPEGSLILIIGSEESKAAKDAEEEGEKTNGFGESEPPAKRNVVWGTGVKARVIAHEIGHNATIDHEGHARERHVMGTEFEDEERARDPGRDGMGFTKDNCRKLRKKARALAKEKEDAEKAEKEKAEEEKADNGGND